MGMQSVEPNRVEVTQLFEKYVFLFSCLTFDISFLHLHSQSETVSVSSIEYSLNSTLRFYRNQIRHWDTSLEHNDHEIRDPS
jgi:hypothetical protein